MFKFRLCSASFFFLAKEGKHLILYSNFYKKGYMLEHNSVASIESFCYAAVGHKRS